MSQPLLQSVENALRILELFDVHNQELGLTEISRRLGVGKSTAHRLLATLESRDFVEQNPEDGRYRLGIKTIHIGSTKLNSINVIAECRQCLETLSGLSEETVHLSFYSNGHITFVDKVPGRNPSVMSSMIGYRLPAYVSASGKVFLAFMPESERELFFRQHKLEPLTPYSITTREALLDALECIRKDGHGEDQQESDEGLVCFAAPVFSNKSKIVAAMSVSGAASRMNARRHELIRMVKEAASAASRRCGYPHCLSSEAAE